MRASIALPIFLLLLAPHFAHAKRLAPPEVAPVVLEGVRYTAPNDDGRRGYLRAEDVRTGKLLREIDLFRNKIDPSLEEDVQWIFIKSMKIMHGKIIVTDEKGRVFSVTKDGLVRQPG